MASILAITIDKCRHLKAEQNYMATIPHSWRFHEVLGTKHPPASKDYIPHCVVSNVFGKQSDTKFEVDMQMPVGEICEKFDIKHVTFTCEGVTDSSSLSEEIASAANDATKKTVNAFSLLMSGGRAFPKKKEKSAGLQGGLNNKDRLFNDVVDLFREKKLDFPRSVAEEQGIYFVQVLSNALWYLTNQHITINETSRRQQGDQPVPAVFDVFTGYNDVKRKKTKSQPLSSPQLKSHSEALYSLLLQPYSNSSEPWTTFSEDIKALACCLSSYQVYLESTAENSDRNKNLPAPVRAIDKHAVVFHCKKSIGFKDKYARLNTAVLHAGENMPVLFNEDVHLSKCFENNSQRFRFFDELSLSVPIDVIKYCPGGGIITTFCLTQVPERRSAAEMLTQGARLVQKMRPQLQEYHTRAERKAFKQILANIAIIQPSVVDFIFSKLALDASAKDDPDMQERLRLISLGETGLLSDMRHLNPGRPNDRYDIFFQTLCGLVEDISAADDRRHGTGIAHLSEWISLGDMIERAAEACPEGTPIPSKTLVRLQFAPTNPYARSALSFTSRVPIQYKIQRRQLRALHPDNHYCAALFKYLKQKTVELKDDAVLYCSDDKAKVPVGEPDKPISTGVRGRISIAPTLQELCALDHDMHVCSLTPSVVLQCKIPESVEASFVRGKVTTVVNDSVFQTSSPFRHTVQLQRISLRHDHLPSILLKYTDGGTDQRNTLESVKCANICLFKELNLDMLIAVRCAPGQSYVNPAERIMSTLNYGLQNVSTERTRLDDESETIIKRCNGMSSLREMAKKHPQLKRKWTESIEPVQALIRNRFQRLKLKDEPFATVDPVTDEELDLLQRHLGELFPGLELDKLQKAHTKKNKKYNDWKKAHCKETNYSFQIRKCNNEDCCLKPTIEEPEKLQWLPDPMLDDTGNHYKTYETLKNLETTEQDRPSLQVQRKKNDKSIPAMFADPNPNTNTAEVAQGDATIVQPSTNTGDVTSTITSDDIERTQAVTVAVEKTSTQAFVPMSTQTARATAVCVECRKPRVIYSKLKLGNRQEIALATTLSAFEYTCGSFLFPPSASQNSIVLRPNLQCATPIELSYYGAELGRTDLCALCGSVDAETDPLLRKEYRTVLPLCEDCKVQGKMPVVQRRYGKAKK